MILHVLAYVATEVLGAVVDAFGRDILSAVLPTRRAPAGRPSPKPVVIGAGAMFDRAALYDAWAEAHGLAPTEKRGAEYAGAYRGRATEMVTGLLGTPLPRSPEILVRVALEGVEGSSLVERGAGAPAHPSLRAMASLLEVEGVRDVGVTRTFVRLRFDAFVTPAVFDAALEALERALRSLAPAEASPYR